MKCNLIIPGFAKCGTSSLHEYLDLHPEICMSRIKEPHYFAINAQYARGPEWHDSLFKHKDELTKWFGESSTLYAVWEPALRRIKKSIINPKFIILLRDPVQRLISHYKWMCALGLENQSLKEAISSEQRDQPDPENSRQGCYPWYLRTSNYSYFCELILEMFGRSNVLIVLSEELNSNPKVTLERSFNFLGVQPFDIQQIIVSNVTKDVKAQRYFGMKALVDHIPTCIRNRLDPSGRLRASLKRALGSRTLKEKPIELSHIEYIKELLAKDSAYYIQFQDANS